MFEPLMDMFEAGLNGDSDKVKEAADEYIRLHYTKVKGINMPYEYRLAKRFKEYLDERENNK